MVKTSPLYIVNGYTLLDIHLCKESIRRRFALEEALEEEKIRNANIYEGFEISGGRLKIQKDSSMQSQPAGTEPSKLCILSSNRKSLQSSKSHNMLPKNDLSPKRKTPNGQFMDWQHRSTDSGVSNNRHPRSSKKKSKSRIDKDTPLPNSSLKTQSNKPKQVLEQISQKNTSNQKAFNNRNSLNSNARHFEKQPSEAKLDDTCRQRRNTNDTSSLTSQWRNSSGSHASIKKLKKKGNQHRCSKSHTCACCTCFTEDLGAIEEEQEEEVTFQCEEKLNATCGCNPFSPPGEEEDACEEFFDIMRDVMEDAVKRSLEDVVGRYFTSCMKKTDRLASQMKCHECLLKKIYTDLNDKISYYGERNAQQFQYLCMRMEQDRLFYQQQQEYFLKSRSQKPVSKETSKNIEQQESSHQNNTRTMPFVRNGTNNANDSRERTLADDNASCEEQSSREGNSSHEEDVGEQFEKGGLKSSKSRIPKPQSTDNLLRNRSQASSLNSSATQSSGEDTTEQAKNGAVKRSIPRIRNRSETSSMNSNKRNKSPKKG